MKVDDEVGIRESVDDIRQKILEAGDKKSPANYVNQRSRKGEPSMPIMCGLQMFYDVDYLN